MKLQSNVNIKPFGFHLDHTSKFFLSGSCFAENIGKKLEASKFKTMVNPMGISYNPISLFNLIERSIDEELFDHSDWESKDEILYNFDLHSDFSGTDIDHLISEANRSLIDQANFISSTQAIILSLGTAWVHVLKKEERLVNNCHKVPASEFNKMLLDQEAILEQFENIHAKIKKFNPKLEIIFTVSPIRHLKDGVHENQLSKSTLLLAVNEICQQFENCHYFPSYEIMMDELRDYRYYERDLIHPTALAIDIIWEKFQASIFNQESMQMIKQIGSLMNSVQHKAFHPESDKHQDFLKKLILELEALQLNSKIDLKDEIEAVKLQLIN